MGIQAPCTNVIIIIFYIYNIWFENIKYILVITVHPVAILHEELSVPSTQLNDMFNIIEYKYEINISIYTLPTKNYQGKKRKYEMSENL